MQVCHWSDCLYNTLHSFSHSMAGPSVLTGVGFLLNAQCQADWDTNACYPDQSLFPVINRPGVAGAVL